MKRSIKAAATKARVPRESRAHCLFVQGGRCPSWSARATLARRSTEGHLSRRIVPRSANATGGKGNAPSHSTGAVPEKVSFEYGIGSSGGRVPMRQVRVWSKYGLHVRPHHAFHSADARIFHQFVHREFSDPLPISPQSLNCNINPDLVPVLKTVRDCLLG